MSWTTIGFTSSSNCLADCSKVLVAYAKPQVHEQVTVIPKSTPTDIVVKTCVQMDEDSPCIKADERTGFYSIITVEK